MIDLVLLDEGLDVPQHLAMLSSSCGVRVRVLPPPCDGTILEALVPKADAFLFMVTPAQMEHRIPLVQAFAHAHPGVVLLAVLDGTDVASREQVQCVISLFKAGVSDVFAHDLPWEKLLEGVRESVQRTHPQTVSGALAGRDRLVLRPDRTLAGALASCTLTAKEAAIAHILLSSDGVISREKLAQVLWQGQWRGTPKAIDMHVANLRRKIRICCGEGYHIETVRGTGFYLAGETQALEATG